jgi:hypothetical protein
VEKKFNCAFVKKDNWLKKKNIASGFHEEKKENPARELF